MNRQALRLAFLAAGLFYLVLAIGYILRWDVVTRLWMWPDTRLSYIFIGAVFAALSAGALFIAWSGRFGAARPSLIGLTVLYGSIAAYLVILWSSEGRPVLPHAVVGGLTALSALVLFRLLRDAHDDKEPLSPLGRWTNAVSVVVLLVVSTGLLARFATIFPWPLSPQTSTVYGLAFLSLATVYGYTAYAGGRAAGVVSLVGLLVYDLVLLPPFLAHFSTVAPERLLSLSVYFTVLVVSGVAAIWFLWREAASGRLRA